MRRYEKLTVAVVSLAVISLIQVLPALARILHWMPDSGTPLYVILGALQLLLGITSTALGIAFPSMMADAADEHELLFGSRREGLYFAGLTLSAKSASGVGAFAAGVGLDLIGFPSNLADSGALHLADDVVRNLGIIWGPGAGLISLLSVVTMLRYRLNRGEHARIRAGAAAPRRRDVDPRLRAIILVSSRGFRWLQRQLIDRGEFLGGELELSRSP